MARKMIWGEMKDGISPDTNYGKSSSRAYVEETAVHFEFDNFDREDNRLYEYSFRFPTDSYKSALEKLQTEKAASIGNEYSYLSMIYDGKKYVYMRFSGTPSPCTSPGGSYIRGAMMVTQTLKQLLETFGGSYSS